MKHYYMRLQRNTRNYTSFHVSLLLWLLAIPLVESFSRLSTATSCAGAMRRCRCEQRNSRFWGTNHGLLPMNNILRLPVESSPTTLHAGMKFKNFEQVLDAFHEEIVIIYFETAKCGPCQVMKKELESVRKLVGDDLKIFSLDTEKFPHLGLRYDIHRLPCLVFVRDGEIRLRMEGVTKAEVVAEHVRTLR
jgi:thioredoxin 1